MTGRGAWPGNGTGGTLNFAGDAPGAYYRLPTGSLPMVGSTGTDANHRAVRGAVKAYQRAATRRTGADLVIDGVYGSATASAIKGFQTRQGILAWGGIGPDTSKALLLPGLNRITEERQQATSEFRITAAIVCGVITTESNWDAGAVGYADETDLGLAQINGPSHPTFSEEDRLMPLMAFGFVFDMLKGLLGLSWVRTIDDAIAGYNLGSGGVQTWINNGRPDIATWYDPDRNVRAYIDKIKTACGG